MLHNVICKMTSEFFIWTKKFFCWLKRHTWPDMWICCWYAIVFKMAYPKSSLFTVTKTTGAWEPVWFLWCLCCKRMLVCCDFSHPSGNEKNWITWVCQKELFVPTFVLELFHHSLLLIRVLAQQLHNLRVLHKKNCQFFLHFPFFLRMIRITLINGFKFFSFGLDLPPSTDIGYFMNLILEWPEMQ